MWAGLCLTLLWPAITGWLIHRTIWACSSALKQGTVEVSMLNLLAWLEGTGLSQNSHSWLRSSRQAKCFSALSEQPTIKGKTRTATNPVVIRSLLGCQVLGIITQVSKSKHVRNMNFTSVSEIWDGRTGLLHQRAMLHFTVMESVPFPSTPTWMQQTTPLFRHWFIWCSLIMYQNHAVHQQNWMPSPCSTLMTVPTLF